MQLTVMAINREGGEAETPAETAWICVNVPSPFEDVVLVVRQPSLQIEQIPWDEDTPHPDDQSYDWPNLPPGLMKQKSN